MTRHDDRILWDYAAGDLDQEEAKVVENHLLECPHCSDRLDAVKMARAALDGAREAVPAIGWEKIDERVGAVVERRLQRQARRTLWLRVAGAGALAAAAALLAVGLFAPSTQPTVAPVALEAPSREPIAARVDRAEGLVRVGTELSPMTDGAALRGGDVLRTTLAGRAFVHLPDASHVRVGGATQLTLTRADADDVALTLERGRIAVKAAHVERKGFVVHASGLTVHVVGTVFSVANRPDGVEVAVSEGRVRLESSTHQLFVDAGQVVRVNTTTGRATRTGLSSAQRQELTEVAATDDAVSAVESRAVSAGAGRSASPSAVVPSRGGPLPRLEAKEARSRQVELPPEATQDLSAAPEEPKQTAAEPPVIVLEEPGNLWPSMAGGVTRGIPQRREDPDGEPAAAPAAPAQPERSRAPVVAAPPPPAPSAAPQAEPQADAEAEWAPIPMPAAAPKQEAPPPAKLSEAPAAPAVSAAPAPSGQKLGDAEAPAKDIESIFLHRAAGSLEKGTCERFLPGLEEIALDAQKNVNTEQARVLRARCFDLLLRPRQAMIEYRKYLGEYPRGRFVPEAREALGN